MLRRYGADWLRSIGALLPVAEQPGRFARELVAFATYMRVERGLSPVTIATREERVRRFSAWLPSRVRSISDVTIGQIDAYLEGEAQRGWRRSSLYSLGGSLRSFFRYAAQQRWCAASVALGIDLPRRYALGDVPAAATVDEVDQLLEATATGTDAVTIRDHALLMLLVHYGLRRGEVERLTLDDIDWAAETLHVMRPKLRRSSAIRCRHQSARPSCATFETHARDAGSAPCSSPSMRRFGHCREAASAPW